MIEFAHYYRYDSRAMNWRQLFPVLLIGAGLWVYHNSFAGPFVFDDTVSIIENPHLRRLWPPSEFLAAKPTTTLVGRPVASFSLALNYAAGKLNVRGYHAVNLTLHLLSALTLFGIVRRTLLGERLRERYAGDAAELALVVALLWLVHPLQTESVTYVSQRTELLMGLFLLLTLYAFIRGWRVVAVAACALGMGSKEVMVVAPLLVLLYDRIFLSATWRELFRQRGGWHAALAATWLVLLALAPLGQLTTGVIGFQFTRLTPWDYARTQCGVISYYLRLCFWPTPLVVDYDDWPVAHSFAVVWPSALLLLGLGTLTVWALWRRKAAGYFGAWFFLILAPSSSILPIATEVAAERRMYLPSAAVIALIVIGVHALAQRWQRRGHAIELGLAGAVAIALGIATLRRNAVYADELTLWQVTVAQRPNNARVHLNLGKTLGLQGRTAEALEHFNAAVLCKPDYAEAHYNIGVAADAQGRRAEAISRYRRAVELKPDYQEAFYNLGYALVQQGNVADAIAPFTTAIRLNPDDAKAHNNLGFCLSSVGRTTEAESEYAEALRLQPDSADAHNNLAVILSQRGLRQEAIAHFREALRLRPDFEAARRALAELQQR